MNHQMAQSEQQIGREKADKAVLSACQQAEIIRYRRECVSRRFIWRFVQALAAVTMIGGGIRGIDEAERLSSFCLVGVSGIGVLVARHKVRRYTAEIRDCDRQIGM